MANKILNLAILAGLGYAGYNALSSKEKQAATQALGFTAVPQNEPKFVALIKSTIKADKELQRILTGPAGQVGQTGHTGETGTANIADILFSNGTVTIPKTGNNASNVLFKGNNKTFKISNINDWLEIYSYDNDMTNPLGVMSISASGVIAKIAGGSFSAISDQRVKDNIDNFKRGLSEVLAIETKTFNYKKVKGTQTEFYPDFLIEKKQYGVIAQQLQAVCPEMVTVGEDGFMTVDLSNLSLLLVNAVKELNAKDIAQQKVIDSQKTEITNLKKSLIAIEERLTKLEAPTA